ncbi:MAG TPA: hypothetical protein VFO83_06445 [Aggregicoccus sp.]|nr:hypothetical protein [Aggregicoccus sp.]
MRRIPVALGVSLLLHALLLLLLWRAEPPPSARSAGPDRAPLVFEVIERAAPPPAPSLPPAPPLATRKRPPALPGTARPPTPEPAREPAPPPMALESDVPRAPRPLELRPRLGWSPAEGSLPPSRGRTLRPGDPSLSAEVQREQERARVQGRLEAFGDEALSQARARGGAPHPYLVEVREALQQGLKDSGPRNPEALGFGKGMQPLLQQYTQNYRAAAEEYGRTGSPGLAEPSAPTQSEKLRELLPEAEYSRALAQASETREAVLNRAPLLALSLELTQGRDGALLNAAIVESSGNRLFDSLVLQVAPSALGTAGPPPADAFRREHLRSLWRVEGRLELSPTARSALTSLLPGVYGIPTAELLSHLRGEQPQLSYGARLLRYY